MLHLQLYKTKHPILVFMMWFFLMLFSRTLEASEYLYIPLYDQDDHEFILDRKKDSKKGKDVWGVSLLPKGAYEEFQNSKKNIARRNYYYRKGAENRPLSVRVSNFILQAHKHAHLTHHVDKLPKKSPILSKRGCDQTKSYLMGPYGGKTGATCAFIPFPDGWRPPLSMERYRYLTGLELRDITSKFAQPWMVLEKGPNVANINTAVTISNHPNGQGTQTQTMPHATYAAAAGGQVVLFPGSPAIEPNQIHSDHTNTPILGDEIDSLIIDTLLPNYAVTQNVGDGSGITSAMIWENHAVLDQINFEQILNDNPMYLDQLYYEPLNDVMNNPSSPPWGAFGPFTPP